VDNYKKKISGPQIFFYRKAPPHLETRFVDMSTDDRNKRTPEALGTIGKVTLEKLESLASKIRDGIATEADMLNHEILREIVALAMNRVSVKQNESSVEQGGTAWTERTASHYPHIRLHGGALEDDPLKMRI
jgi:hypothetical protein